MTARCCAESETPARSKRAPECQGWGAGSTCCARVVGVGWGPEALLLYLKGRSWVLLANLLGGQGQFHLQASPLHPHPTCNLTLYTTVAMNWGYGCWLDRNSPMTLFMMSWGGKKSSRNWGRILATTLASQGKPFLILGGGTQVRAWHQLPQLPHLPAEGLGSGENADVKSGLGGTLGREGFSKWGKSEPKQLEYEI